MENSDKVMPDPVVLSQSSLQDFVDCRRRFQLRYIQRLAWPAVECDPVLEQERLMRQGARFHQMIHQYFLGIDVDQLSGLIHDPDLQRWWDWFLSLVDGLCGRVLPMRESVLNGGEVAAADLRRIPEASFTAPLAGVRLVAKCDLIQVTNDGRLVIYDWKTSRKRPRRSWLAERLQTRLYPYILARSGAHLLGQPLNPEQIEMVYWFTDFSAQPERFGYSQQQYQADETYLSGLIEQLHNLRPEKFSLTDNLDHCRFCVYRSLCNRGVQAGNLSESSTVSETLESLDLQVDFEHLPGIEF